MPVPTERDVVETEQRLGGWLARRIPGATDVEVSGLSVPEGTGYSNETLMFDAAWRQGGESRKRSLVARLEPTRYQVFPEPDIRREYEVITRLAACSDVPLPPTLWMEDDAGVLGARFFVMEKVDGSVPADVPPYNAEGFLVDMSPEERRELWDGAFDAFCAIHGVDPQKDGFGFLDRSDRGAPGLEQFLVYLEGYYEWAMRRPNQIVESAWEWIREHRPSGEPIGLVWGDARIQNMIFQDTRCAAVLDWEMVTLGSPEQDLGWWLFLDEFSSQGMGVPRLEGLPGRSETIEIYEERTGHEVRNVEFYEVVSGFHFALILMKIYQMQEDFGVLGPDDVGAMERDNPVTKLLAEHLGLPASTV